MPSSDRDWRPLAVPTTQVENDRFIVTEWRFAPHAHTGWHRHAHDYVVVPMTTGRLLLATANGPVSSDLVSGIAYAREAGVEHDVINDNPGEFVFIEIEARQEIPSPQHPNPAQTR
ncbi:MAG: cupin domain-containing protein [Thermomicrobiales bacterium]